MLQAGVEIRQVGYGLPCAQCKTYFAANLSACPICSCNERVSPTAASPQASADSEPLPDAATLEEERERFLKEFKSQVYASHVQINAAASLCCSLDANHLGAIEAAEVCKACYDRLQQRADLMEAALHMDLKDATQLIYQAVWSDSSDPNKSYENAARAVLAELRKRAGINTILGPLQPLTH
jgi:hypothetical protein